MTQSISNHENHFSYDLNPAEREIVNNIKKKIHQSIDHVSPAVAYELSQVLGLLSQIARTKDIDEKNGMVHSIVNSIFGRPDIIVPREELLEMLETASTILTEDSEESKKSQQQRLIFAREIIYKIDIQSRKFPNPLASLYARYATLEDRLLSGVVWFFTLFFVFPSASILAMMIYHARKAPEINEEAFRNSVQNIITVQSNMFTSLEEIKSEVNEIISSQATVVPVEESGQSPESLPQETGAIDSISVPISTINQIGASVNNGLQDTANIENAKKSLASLIEDESSDRSDTSDKQDLLDIIGLEINSLVWAEIFVLLVSVAMGALGGSVSVIMTSDKLVNVTKRKKVDSFYIGFFRPFIGMAFAIFVVSLIESGVFSNIFNPEESRQPRERLYLFAAIAFVAGFSERFAPGLADQVSRTPLREEPEPKDDD